MTKRSENSWAIIVHGGAQAIKEKDKAKSKQQVRKALQAGTKILQAGGSSVDAVERAVRSMEDGGVFNAGKGSDKNADEEVQMDASIMDGRTLAVGAIACVKDVENPIVVARALLGEKAILLVGKNAEKFARQVDAKPRKYPAKDQDLLRDTVGCVAIDRDGNIATALSTGGLKDSMPGRVGDSVMPGCGFYADNSLAGVCLTGEGEFIARLMMAARIMHKLETKEPKTAMKETLAWLEKVNGEAGCILVTKDRNIFWHHNSKNMAVAYQKEGQRPFVGLRNKESSHYP